MNGEPVSRERLLELIAQGMTKSEIAREIGVSRQAVSARLEAMGASTVKEVSLHCKHCGETYTRSTRGGTRERRFCSKLCRRLHTKSDDQLARYERHRERREMLAQGKRRCTVCKEIKDLSEFSFSSIEKQERSTRCKTCTYREMRRCHAVRSSKSK